VKRICEKYEKKLVSIDALDYGLDLVGEEAAKMNAEKDIWFCHITTEDGYHYVTCDETVAVLFHGPTKTAVGSLLLLK